jgi:acetylornithine deacetylase/succinyl-diaminopimelate desuccinylase-like protein
MSRAILFVLLTIVIGVTDSSGQTLSPRQRLARDIYKELIELNTTDSAGNTTVAAEAMARRLKDAGLPATDVRVLGPDTRKGNLVARLRGSGARRPILLLAHIDVVEAKKEDWSTDPFKLVEQDGYFYGRGTSDDKAMAAIFVANLTRYKQEGFVPGRDIILALTADEELLDVPTNGVKWLMANHRRLIDAELALNEGGGVYLRTGKPFMNRRSQRPRRPQRRTEKGQRDRPSGRRSRPARSIRFSDEAHGGDARLFPAHGGIRRRAGRR